MDDGSWGIAAPHAHGPDGCSLSATRLNVSTSGQHEASAMRTRLGRLNDAAGDFQQTQTDGGELGLPQRIPTRDRSAQVDRRRNVDTRLTLHSTVWCRGFPELRTNRSGIGWKIPRKPLDAHAPDCWHWALNVDDGKLRNGHLLEQLKESDQ